MHRFVYWYSRRYAVIAKHAIKVVFSSLSLKKALPRQSIQCAFNTNHDEINSFTVQILIFTLLCDSFSVGNYVNARIEQIKRARVDRTNKQAKQTNPNEHKYV